MKSVSSFSSIDFLIDYNNSNTSLTLKMHYFFNNYGLYSQAQIRQTKYKVMKSKEESTKIVNFKTPWEGVLVLGCGHTSQIVKMYYFLKYRMQ